MTLAEWAKIQDRANDAEIGIINEAIKNNPEFSSFNVRGITGTDYKIFQRTALAKGGFRDINTGVASATNAGSQKTISTYFYDSQISIDEALVLGDNGQLGDLMTEEGSAMFTGCLQDLSSQIYHGDNDTTDGFDGFDNQMDDDMILKAAASVTAGTPYAEVYFVNSSLQGVSFIVGKNTPLSLGEVYQSDVADSNGKTYRAYCQRMRGWYGLQVGNTKSVGKITNLTTELTQEMLFEMLLKFPNLLKPTGIYMNNTALKLWASERSKIVQVKSGSAKLDIKADYNSIGIDSFMGIPIYQTDSIVDVANPAPEGD